MLRNLALTLFLVLVTALAETAAGDRAEPAAVCAGLAGAGAVGAVGAVREGRKMQHWARLKTLELCFWIPDLDERLRR
ncbi:hypothetical protein ACHZ98_34900 [Streptomyces sp. MAR4 CNY-716]